MINENLSDKAEKNLKNKTKFGENNGRPKQYYTMRDPLDYTYLKVYYMEAKKTAYDFSLGTE